MTESAPQQLWHRLTFGRPNGSAVSAAAATAPVGRATALAFLNEAGDVVYRHDELRDAVQALGARLRELPGLRSSAVVAILSGEQHAQALHFLAALSVGFVPAILTPPTRKQDPRQHALHLAATLEAVSPDVVVTDSQDLLSGYGGLVAEVWTCTTVPGRLPSRTRAAVLPPDGTAFLQFSSGTTGAKKGVAISATAALAQLDAYGTALELSADDRIVNWLPLYHDMGLITSLLLPLAFGVPSRMLEPLEWVARPSSYLRAVSRHRATLGWHPNFAFSFLADRIRPHELADVDLSSLRALVNCAEPVTARAQQRFLDRFGPIGLSPTVFAGCWAMAETTFALTHGLDTQPDSGTDDTTPVSVGRCLPGVEIEVRSGTGEVLADETVGELWARAPFLASGYAGNPGATAAAFVDGWYRTGDLGFRRSEQYYVYGRTKDVIIASGHNVFPDDVEALVAADPGVRPGRVAAFGEFDERMQTQRVVVLAEPSGKADPDRAGILQLLSVRLGLTGVRLVVVEPGWLVKSSSGKISRSACASKWQARIPAPRPTPTASPTRTEATT